MEKKIVQIIIHMAAWVCFLMVPFIFYPRPREISFFTERYFLVSFIITNILLIAFYYLNTLVFIPRLLEHKKFLIYGLIILVLLIFFGCLPRIYHYFFAGWQNPPPGSRPPGRPRN